VAAVPAIAFVSSPRTRPAIASATKEASGSHPFHAGADDRIRPDAQAPRGAPSAKRYIGTSARGGIGEVPRVAARARRAIPQLPLTRGLSASSAGFTNQRPLRPPRRAAPWLPLWAAGQLKQQSRRRRWCGDNAATRSVSGETAEIVPLRKSHWPQDCVWRFLLSVDCGSGRSDSADVWCSPTRQPPRPAGLPRSRGAGVARWPAEYLPVNIDAHSLSSNTRRGRGSGSPSRGSCSFTPVGAGSSCCRM